MPHLDSIPEDMLRLAAEEALGPEHEGRMRLLLETVLAEGVDPFDLIQALEREEDFEEAPVSLRTFVYDSEYLNLDGQVWPKLVDDLERFFAGDYREAVLKGGIGWGKTTWADLAQAYMIYKCSCLKNPQRYYGLMEGTVISFVNISVNSRQAKRVIFKGLVNLISRSPYFRTRFMPDPHVTSELRFPKDIWVAPVASRQTNVIGEHVFGGVMDESNFLPVIEDSIMARPGETTYDVAATLYNAIARRLQSRFNVAGRVPGKIIVVSSSQYPDDFTERKAKEAESDPGIFVLDYSQWQTKPRHIYLPGRFRMELGDETHGSRVLAPREIPANPSAEVVEDIPEDYRRTAELDPDGFVQDVIGRPTTGVRPFIRRRETLAAAIDHRRVHPFPFEEMISSQDMTILTEHLAEQVDVLDARGNPTGQRRWQPKWFPNAIRMAHVDLALTGDGCGVSMGCSPERHRVLRWDMERECEYEDTAPVLFFDFVVIIRRPPGGEIGIKWVRTAVLRRMIALGFKLRRVTYDRWQSAESIQEWTKSGVKSELLSVDTDTLGYDALKSGFYEGRVLTPANEAVFKELRGLQEDVKKKKIDHRPRGSKDGSDAMAGVAHQLTFSPMAAPAMALPSAKDTVPHGLPIDNETYRWLMDEGGDGEGNGNRRGLIPG